MGRRISSKIALFVGGVGVLVVSAVACSESDDNASGFGGVSASGADASSDVEAAPYPDAGTVLGPCTLTVSGPVCPTNYECLYPIIEGCGAQPVCVAPAEPRCDLLVVGCGCDGGGGGVPCGVTGYATGPITGTVNGVPGPDGGFIEQCVPFGASGDGGP